MLIDTAMGDEEAAEEEGRVRFRKLIETGVDLYYRKFNDQKRKLKYKTEENLKERNRKGM